MFFFFRCFLCLFFFKNLKRLHKLFLYTFMIIYFSLDSILLYLDFLLDLIFIYCLFTLLFEIVFIVILIFIILIIQNHFHESLFTTIYLQLRFYYQFMIYFFYFLTLELLSLLICFLYIRNLRTPLNIFSFSFRIFRFPF